MGNKEYFKEWYLRNREALSQRRKDRYRNDSEYRARVLAAPRKPRARVDGAVRIEGDNLLCTDGVWRRVIGLSDLSDLIGVRAETLSRWHDNGIIPATPYVVGRRKYFTQNMADAFIGALVECGYSTKQRIHIRVGDERLRNSLHAAWSGLPECANSDQNSSTEKSD